MDTNGLIKIVSMSAIKIWIYKQRYDTNKKYDSHDDCEEATSSGIIIGYKYNDKKR